MSYLFLWYHNRDTDRQCIEFQISIPNFDFSYHNKHMERRYIEVLNIRKAEKVRIAYRLISSNDCIPYEGQTSDAYGEEGAAGAANGNGTPTGSPYDRLNSNTANGNGHVTRGGTPGRGAYGAFDQGNRGGRASKLKKSIEVQS